MRLSRKKGKKKNLHLFFRRKKVRRIIFSRRRGKLLGWKSSINPLPLLVLNCGGDNIVDGIFSCRLSLCASVSFM